jgi:hypothetical protein
VNATCEHVNTLRRQGVKQLLARRTRLNAFIPRHLTPCQFSGEFRKWLAYRPSRFRVAIDPEQIGRRDATGYGATGSFGNPALSSARRTLPEAFALSRNAVT